MIVGLESLTLCDTPPYITPRYYSVGQGEEARAIREREQEVLRHVAERRIIPPPFHVLTLDVAVEISERWKEPCEALFEHLAVRHPAALIRLIDMGGLEPADLTYAAEYAGRLRESGIVRHALLPLLAHPSAVVREGAIYGIQRHLNVEARACLAGLAQNDPNSAVREAAVEALEEP